MANRLSEADLERIYDETIAELYGFVSRRCGGQRELAEDVTQETWMRALRHWRTRGAPENPIGWLTTVARNLIVSHFRRHEGVSLDASVEDVLTPSQRRCLPPQIANYLNRRVLRFLRSSSADANLIGGR
jgi:DNA-directed RNA polymerase specialized sigma24 family protein